MMLQDRRGLKNAANDSINNAVCQPGKLVLFHTAVVLVLSLVALLVDFLLEQQIGNTGGLDGMGTRSVLETAQKMLRWAQIIAVPFWQLGWVFATVKIARGERTEKPDLLEGFRRFFPYLRLTVLKGLIFIGVAITAVYISSFVVVMTPLADPMMDMMTSDLATITAAEWLAQMERVAVPMTVISTVLSVALMVPFFYRFRMAEYVLLDNPGIGARVALRGSRILMRGNLWKLMGLDLSFGWFWLLTLIVSALGWADILLPKAGVELPWTAEISYFAAFALSAVAQLVLYYFCKAKVDVTYAHAYMTLLPDEENVYESH